MRRTMTARPSWVLLLVVALLALVPGLPAQAADPYAADPLRLVADLDRGRIYSGGEDVWELWMCDVPDGAAAVDVGSAATALDSELSRYYSSVSEGRYSPRVVAGGVVVSSSPSGWPANPLLRQVECEQRVAAAGIGSEGAIIVVDAPYGGGYGTPGLDCSGCPTTFPANGRLIVVGAEAVTAGRLRTVAHEIGHAVAFPHSYGGLLTFLGGMTYEYDNPMDLMSGGSADTLDIGTHALNRYAAGWIDPAAVVFHRGGEATYTLGVAGAARLLVLPTDEGDGVYETLGARVRAGVDAGVPAEGVEVYRIDQRGSACGLGTGQVCSGLLRRTQPLPPGTSPTSADHVLRVGATATIRGVTVTVVDRVGDGFSVRVAGRAVSDRFVDDAGIHESSIETIADRGITLGCNPPRNDLYCPGRGVTRAEMAVFLLRALGETIPPAGSGIVFPDVAAGSWYAGAVERLAALGVTAGYADGTFGPGRVVTRGEMAVFLTRALPTLTPVPAAGIFADVAPSAWYASAAEGLAAAGVTAGCRAAPLSYCPADPVLRDQMATFLDRSLMP